MIYEIEAFEVGARAGHHVRDILEQLLEDSSIAFLVLTGEDEMADQKMRARQNVIHETGLFQGRLGFSKAIVLLENGVEEFSNLDGIQHITFERATLMGFLEISWRSLKENSTDHLTTSGSPQAPKRLPTAQYIFM
jgi:Predicted nucleotide-binding protein containing TIR-like domain